MSLDMEKVNHAAQGMLQSFESHLDVIEALDALKEDFLPMRHTGEQILFSILHYRTPDKFCSWLIVNRIKGKGYAITFLFDSINRRLLPKTITDKNGIWGYVYYVDYPWDSELRKVYFKEQNGELKRIK